jgi:guanylate kinase
MMNSLNKPVFEYNNAPRCPLIIVISGPSGVGKDTILNRMKERSYRFKFITTVTTRQRREKEREGVDYHFVTPAAFHELRNNHGLLEFANVYGNWYGVPRQPVKEALEKGLDTIIKVDIQGAANIKKILPGALFIFIMPPSSEELFNRLTRRSTENTADLSVRLKTAEDEIKQIENFDYVVMNQSGNVENAIQEILAIVTAEKCRVNPRLATLD